MSYPAAVVCCIDISSVLTLCFRPCRQLHVHGIRISFVHDRQRYSATYLPGVALEQGWTKAETLISLVRKAGYRGELSCAVICACLFFSCQVIMCNVWCWQGEMWMMTFSSVLKLCGISRQSTIWAMTATKRMPRREGSRHCAVQVPVHRLWLYSWNTICRCRLL